MSSSLEANTTESQESDLVSLKAGTTSEPDDREFETAALDSPVRGRRATPSLGPGEVRRRLWHMLPGLLPFVLLSIPHHDPLLLWGRLVVVALALLLTGIILRNYRKIARPGERQWLINVLSYPATAVVMMLLFPANLEFAAAVLIIVAFGDGSATLFGLLYGRRTLPWNPNKTWVGFGSFFLCSTPVAVLAIWWEATPVVSWTYAITCGAFAAGLAAVAESLPLKITDNLRAGVAAAFGVVAAHGAMVGFA